MQFCKVQKIKLHIFVFWTVVFYLHKNSFTRILICEWQTIKTIAISLDQCDTVSLSFVYQPFPGQPGQAVTRMSPFWILLELRMIEVVVTTGAIRLLNSSQIVTTNRQLCIGRTLPVAQPTVSKHWRESPISPTCLL